jgi:hypothetical protein
MATISVLNVREQRGEDKFRVYVGRPSQLGNPFVIGRDGDRDAVIEKYRRWLWERVQERGDVYNQLVAICDRIRSGRDVHLYCHCAPLHCHGDVIKRCCEWMLAQR